MVYSSWLSVASNARDREGYTPEAQSTATVANASECRTIPNAGTLSLPTSCNDDLTMYSSLASG